MSGVRAGRPGRVSLARALSKLGITSRRLAEDRIAAGEVAVNGCVVRDPAYRVDLGRDEIRIGGRPARAPRRIYRMLHKPAGVVTTRSDERGRKTVYDLMPATDGWLFPVGRLDRDASGLLLFTNDTRWAAAIAAPESEIPKVYHARVRPPVGEEDLRRLASGVVLGGPDGGKTRPARARIVRTTGKSCWVELAITEGRNRQVRRMLAALGYEVSDLVRIAIGPLRLGVLPSGKWRDLTPDEVWSLNKAFLRHSNRSNAPARG